MSKVQMGARRVFELIRYGIQHGRFEAVLGVIDDCIAQLPPEAEFIVPDNECACGCPEREHETIEYRGTDKPRHCLACRNCKRYEKRTRTVTSIIRENESLKARLALLERSYRIDGGPDLAALPAVAPGVTPREDR